MTGHADAVVIGGGVVGTTTALGLAERGARVTLISAPHAGEASPAAAGMLAPGVERATGAAHAFAIAARDYYPALVAKLLEATGVSVPLDLGGILELAAASDASGAQLEGRTHTPDEEWLPPATLARLEPALAPTAGALMHRGDGAVDNVALMHALRSAVGRSRGITVIPSAAAAIDGDLVATVTTHAGDRFSAPTIVLAAGAWSPALRGLPRRLPIEPVRGQMIALGATPLGHVTYGGGGYAVPRANGVTVVGSTMEHAGFDAVTTEQGAVVLMQIAAAIAPTLGAAPRLAHWSGLRPVTPDGLPILGRDPARATLVYACGHSRNGILLGPLSGECIAALVVGESPSFDLSAFDPERFEKGDRTSYN